MGFKKNKYNYACCYKNITKPQFNGITEPQLSKVINYVNLINMKPCYKVVYVPRKVDNNTTRYTGTGVGYSVNTRFLKPNF